MGDTQRHARTLRRAARPIAAGLAVVFLVGPGAVVAQTQRAQTPEAPSQASDEELFEFPRFATPMSLRALVDLVAKELDTQITLSDATLNAEVEVLATMRVPRNKLMDLLELLLAQHGQALEKTEEGWYFVKPVKDLSLDFDEGEHATTRLFSPPLLKPSALEGALGEVLGEKDKGLARLTAVDELGLLISTAPNRVNKKISQLVERILEEQDRYELFNFPLEHIAAGEARTRLLELAGLGGGAGADQERPQGAPAGGLVSMGERLLVDKQGNALIFRGVEAETKRIRELLEIVDTPSRLIIRRYFAGPLAEEIIGYGERLGLGVVADGAGGDSSGSSFALASDEGRFTYYGTERQHERVAELIEEFAYEAQEEEMAIRFYKLNNADAVEVQGILDQLMTIDELDEDRGSPFFPESQRGADGIRRVEEFDRARDGAAAGDEPADGVLTPTEGVRIIADESLNQLIIRAPARQHREFERIVASLDVRRPQVFLEVQIVSVSDSENFTWNIDAIFTDTDSEFQLSTSNTVTGLLTAPLTGPGLTTAIIKSDYVPVVVNWFETEGEGKVISRPSILVNDNEQGSFNSTRNVFFNQTTQTAGNPSTTSVGGSVSAGTVLTATPQISDGGVTHLELDVELSAFGEQANPDLPPDTTQDSISTIVTVPSDATVVLSGFAFESDNETATKTPFLGDVPLLGNLFKDKGGTKTRRRVFIFITPRALRDESFADLRLLTEGYAPAAGIDPHLPELQPEAIPLLEGMFWSGPEAAAAPDAEREAPL